jgi:hypothetical protein
LELWLAQTIWNGHRGNHNSKIGEVSGHGVQDTSA